MTVVGLILSGVLSGCNNSGIEISPSIVAEDFVKAIIQKNPSEALDLCDIKLYGTSFRPGFEIKPTLKSKSDIRNLKEEFEMRGKESDDDKLEGVAVMEVIMTPTEFFPTYHVDGKEYTGESAEVTVQYMRGDDKKTKGMKVRLVKVDGLWKVMGYDMVSNLDDAD